MLSKSTRESSRVTGAVRWIGFVGALVVLGAATSIRAEEMLASLPTEPNGTSGTNGSPVIEIWKTDRKLQLRQGDSLLGEFRVALGQQPRNGKELRGDGRTPVGRY